MICLLLIFTFQGFYVNFESLLTYEDNIFHYSDEHISEFRDGVNLNRYPFYSIDDVISTVSVSLKNRGRGGTLNFHLTQHQFLKNTEKSYVLFHLNFWRRLLSNAYIQVGIKYIPSYLIRYMAGGDPQHYTPCEYEQSIVQVISGYDLDPVSLSFYVERLYDDYHEDFDYYDTEAFKYGLSLRLKSFYGFSPYISYIYKKTTAKEKYPDISHMENRFGINLRKKLVGTSFELSYTYTRRSYTTDIDLYHKDRIDREHSVSLEFKRLIIDRLYLTVGYELRKRYVTSPYNLRIDEEKDFTLNSLNLGFDIKLR